MKTLLCLGECMIEMAEQADGSYRRGFAGDTFNTAWYARRLLPDDWQVRYGTGIGEDAVSAEMAIFMRDSGIDISALRGVPDRSVGLYMISLKAGERSFSYWRNQSAARTLADDPGWLAATMGAADAIYFSGITLAILAPEARVTFCAALATARDAGATIAFDTNLRPALWEDADTMRAGLSAGGAVADIVLPSFDEDGPLFGDANPQATIERYLTGGARYVVVKNGAGDVTFWDGAAIDTIPTLPAELVDSTAAGDSFAAGFISSHLMGASIRQSAIRAAALAARVIAHRGALMDEAALP